MSGDLRQIRHRARGESESDTGGCPIGRERSVTSKEVGNIGIKRGRSGVGLVVKMDFADAKGGEFVGAGTGAAAGGAGSEKIAGGATQGVTSRILARNTPKDCFTTWKCRRRCASQHGVAHTPPVGGGKKCERRRVKELDISHGGVHRFAESEHDRRGGRYPRGPAAGDTRNYEWLSLRLPDAAKPTHQSQDAE